MYIQESRSRFSLRSPHSVILKETWITHPVKAIKEPSITTIMFKMFLNTIQSEGGQGFYRLLRKV